MNIQNLSKENKKVTVELSSDELVKICNVLYQTEEKKMTYIINFIASL